MVSTWLREFLQNLCCDSPWDYAVFWKLQQLQNQMLLTWEDGLFDISRPMGPMEGTTDSFYFDNSVERLYSTCPSSIQKGSLGDCPIGVAMAEMSSICYVMGKGLVGEVAYADSPSWIFVDNFMAGGFNPNLISEFPDKLLHQFVAGIKTILLVPFVPHGVLQLGSVDMIQEDAGVVTNVKNKFYTHQQFATCFSPFRSGKKFQRQPMESFYMENLGESSSDAMVKIDEDLKVLGNVGLEGHKMSNTNQIMSTVHDPQQIFRKDMTNFIDKGSESTINTQSVGLIDASEPFNHQMLEHSKLEMILNHFGSSCLDGDLECFSNFCGYGTMNCKNPVDEIMQSYSNDGIVEQLVSFKDCDSASYERESQILRFPTDCELHKALGPVMLYRADVTLSGENAAASSVCNEAIVRIKESSAWDSNGRGPSKHKTEYLLEAVVANASSTSDDSSSNRSDCIMSFKSSSVTLDCSPLVKVASAEENQVPWSCVTSVHSGEMKSETKLSPSASPFGCMIDALLEERPHRNGNCPMRPTKGSKLHDANKRRVRSGDNQKPRPRDRQLIQDRIKELRGLVPNGSKCSIDGLLDRTIKHMQFLTGVTDQADKLRQHIVNKISSQKDVKSPKAESNTKTGRSWALELGNEQQKCPVIVKDLEHAGHMLIEMLCNDHGRFLEIADVIHRLELTILKGGMERRSDDTTWAHFIVEASDSFHRLDIFWPLMQLLQQSPTQISSKI